MSLSAILLALIFSSSSYTVSDGIFRQNKDFQSLKHEIPDPTNELVLHFFYGYKGNEFDRDAALKFIERHGLTILKEMEFIGPFLDERGATIASGVGLFLVEAYGLCVEQTANNINRNFYPQIAAVPNYVNQKRRFTTAESMFGELVLSTAINTAPQYEYFVDCFADCLAEGDEYIIYCVGGAAATFAETGNIHVLVAGVLACGAFSWLEIGYCAYGCAKVSW